MLVDYQAALYSNEVTMTKCVTNPFVEIASVLEISTIKKNQWK